MGVLPPWRGKGRARPAGFSPSPHFGGSGAAPEPPDGCGRRHLGGPPGDPRSPPRGERPHPAPGHAGPGLGWQPASGILGEEKGGRGGDGKYSVATARREAGSAKRAPGFIGGLYRTFYYNLGDDSFLYVACYTAGPLQPVNVQRGPGLAVGASPRPGKGLRDRAAPSAPTAEEVGEKTLRKGQREGESGEWKAIPPPTPIRRGFRRPLASPCVAVWGCSRQSIPLVCGQRLRSTARTALCVCVIYMCLRVYIYRYV